MRGRCTAKVNAREGWRGHLWQGRFASYVMDDRYTLAAARYVELNPVRAGLVARAQTTEKRRRPPSLIECVRRLFGTELRMVSP
jgi:hypothetical protein